MRWLANHRFAQFCELAPGDVRPLAGAVELEIVLPVVDGFERVAGAFAEQRDVEMRVGVTGIERQRPPVALESVGEAILLA